MKQKNITPSVVFMLGISTLGLLLSHTGHASTLLNAPKINTPVSKVQIDNTVISAKREDWQFNQLNSRYEWIFEKQELAQNSFYLEGTLIYSGYEVVNSENNQIIYTQPISDYLDFSTDRFTSNHLKVIFFTNSPQQAEVNINRTFFSPSTGSFSSEMNSTQSSKIKFTPEDSSSTSSTSVTLENWLCYQNHEQIARSTVAIISYNQGDTEANLCSGNIVNNQAQNGQVNILTAGHCQMPAESGKQAVVKVYFQPFLACGAGLGTATSAARVSTTDVNTVLINHDEDVWLLNIPTVPIGASVYYAGLNFSPITPTQTNTGGDLVPGYSISYPNGYAATYAEANPYSGGAIVQAGEKIAVNFSQNGIFYGSSGTGLLGSSGMEYGVLNLIDDSDYNQAYYSALSNMSDVKSLLAPTSNTVPAQDGNGTDDMDMLFSFVNSNGKTNLSYYVNNISDCLASSLNKDIWATSFITGQWQTITVPTSDTYDLSCTSTQGFTNTLSVVPSKSKANVVTESTTLSSSGGGGGIDATFLISLLFIALAKAKKEVWT